MSTASPHWQHDAESRIGVLLVNLGTPDAPTPAAVRRYLAQFLSDPRVVEIPRLAWWPILHGVVLRTRPSRSARKYALVWTSEGSPLTVNTSRQAPRLEALLRARGWPASVRWAMRYGAPEIGRELDALCEAGCVRILVLPAYPQYCAATTASAFDHVADWMRRTRRLPELRFVNHYHDEPAYIDALAAHVRRHRQVHGPGRVLVLSFHGMPRRTLDLGDPYHCECLKTARLLAEALGLAADQWRVTFQSRFGRAAWLQPATDATLAALARAGQGVDVLCPGFAVDCLETLEEIALEGRAAFVAAGGREFHYLPCLNDSAEGMHALAEVVARHLQGWAGQEPPAPERARRRERALAAGALE